MTGHLARKIEEHFEKRPTEGVRLLREDSPLGTAGCLASLRPYMHGEESFLLLNGDTFIDADLMPLLAGAGSVSESSPVCLSLIKVRNAARYGSVTFMETSGNVVGFGEEQAVGEPSSWVSAGAYLLSTHLLDRLDGRSFVSLEDDVLPALLQEGKSKIRAVCLNGRFFDIGLPKSYAAFCAERFASCFPADSNEQELVFLIGATVLEGGHIWSLEALPDELEGFLEKCGVPNGYTRLSVQKLASAPPAFTERDLLIRVVPSAGRTPAAPNNVLAKNYVVSGTANLDQRIRDAIANLEPWTESFRLSRGRVKGVGKAGGIGDQV